MCHNFVITLTTPCCYGANVYPLQKEKSGQSKRGRGRPRLPEEEKLRRKELRDMGLMKRSKRRTKEGGVGVWVCGCVVDYLSLLPLPPSRLPFPSSPSPPLCFVPIEVAQWRAQKVLTPAKRGRKPGSGKKHIIRAATGKVVYVSVDLSQSNGTFLQVPLLPISILAVCALNVTSPSITPCHLPVCFVPIEVAQWRAQKVLTPAKRGRKPGSGKKHIIRAATGKVVYVSVDLSQYANGTVFLQVMEGRCGMME